MQDTGYGYCQCGCGEKTNLHPRTVPKFGYVKGEPRAYILNHNKRAQGPRYRIDENGCWIFLGYIDAKGYGQMRSGDRMHPAHRIFYEQTKGPIPEGMQLDHLCHDPDTCVGGPGCQHRRCVNPNHLQPVTNRENAYRGQTRPGSKQKPGRKPMPTGLSTFNGSKTHCKNGHPFDAENTYVHPRTGKRTCRACQSLWHKTNKPWLRRDR